MSRTDDSDRFSGYYPSEIRRSVSSQNQFQLPATLVSEIGFKSPRLMQVDGAMVTWYYHEKHHMAVLSTEKVDRQSLEFIGGASLGGVSNEDLETNDVSGGRVTIISDLPEDLYGMLTRDEVILKPIYANENASLENTCVSVYPAKEYDNGDLPNVDRQQMPIDCKMAKPSNEDKDMVGNYDSHTNSV